ncbi:MAG TPA: hypothetical protein ENG95_05950, partial [Nitrospirae bacterium]|nr:hypothetical protein [Nitrospirota bacterium]
MTKYIIHFWIKGKYQKRERFAKNITVCTESAKQAIEKEYNLEPRKYAILVESEDCHLNNPI